MSELFEDGADRVLEYALLRTLGDGDGAREADLAARILQAWSRGVTGSVDVDEVDLDAPLIAAPPRNGAAEPGPARPPRSFALPPIAYAAAAAAVLLLLALAWQLRRPAPGPLPFAVAGSSVELLSGADLAARSGTEIRSGDAVLVESAPVDLHLANGAEARVEAGTVLVAFEGEDGPALELVQGSLALRTGVEPLRITAGFAGIRALPGSQLTARVELEQQGGGSSLAARARTLLRRGSADKRSLSMNVTLGAAEFEHDGVVLTVVPTPGPRTVAGPVLLVEEDIERFDALFEELCLLRETSMYEPKGLSERIRDLGELSSVLARSSPLWSRLAALIAERRADPEASQAFVGNVIDFLHTDPSAEALALASDLWLEVPERFNETHLVTFAERGAFEFQREIEAMVEMYEPVEDPRLQPFGLEPPVLAATYLAVRGNDVGRALLAGTTSDIQTAEWVAPWGMLSALGLDALGDREAWILLEEGVQDFVEGYLLANELIGASRILLQYEYFRGLRDDPETPILGTVQRDALRWVEVRANEVQSEAEIVALMHELFG